MSPHVPLGKLSEQPPPFNFSEPAIYVPPNNPLTPEQNLRAQALAAAVAALPEHTGPEEYVVAAHWIATGQILEGSNNE